MFMPVLRHLFWWPVTVAMPDPDRPGKFAPQTFEMQFEALPIDRAREIEAVRETLPLEEREAHAFDILFEIASSWRDVAGPDREDIPFSREIYAEQLQYPWFRDGVLRAYGEATSGQEARLGN